MRGNCVEPPSTFDGTTSYWVYSQSFMVKGEDGKRHKGADTRLVSCLPDDDVEFGDQVEFNSLYPYEGNIRYVHGRVIVKHIRSAESDLPVLPYVPFGAG